MSRRDVDGRESTQCTAGAIKHARHKLTNEKVKVLAETACECMRKSDCSYRRDHLRAVAQRIEVIDKTKARIMGSRTALLKTLTAADAHSAAIGGPDLELKWRTRQDSNL